MALIKCKECGEQVSTKAKTCPSCGAKPPKKTSAFTWFVLGLILFTIYIAKQNPSTNTTASGNTQASSSATNTATPTKAIEPVAPEWGSSSATDEMTGKKSNYVNSITIGPTKPMEFPYHDTKAWLGVGCDSKSEWVYIGFNNSPNLSDTETEDGYNVINTRIKWNGAVENVKLTQKWSAKFIHFKNGAHIISKILNSDTAMLELQWHGQQPAYFEFPLKGASEAIKNMRKSCANK
jgi:RNA polymerase subunit RPABC4/transcription elongation factor Spt4